MNVNISMEENAGLDVIVNSTAGVSAPGVPSASGRAVPPDRDVLGGRHRRRVLGPLGAGADQPDDARRPRPSTVVSSNSASASGSPTVHGTLTALYNSLGQARTVNTLPLEQYVADTVPGESPSSWASLGGAGPAGPGLGLPGARGASRRRALLRALRPRGLRRLRRHLRPRLPDLPTGTQYETPTSIAAANDTAGQVMVMPGGQVATTEYSSSTGGYTSSAQQQSPFTAVPDDGDAICPNAAIRTTSGRPRSAYAPSRRAWPQIGSFTGFGGATSDPGHPYDFTFGRVDTITLDGTAEYHHDPRYRVLRRPRTQVSISSA